MTTVWSYGTVESTFSVPSANQVSIRRNAMFLSASEQLHNAIEQRMTGM